jgi:hypothetical protein
MLDGTRIRISPPRVAAGPSRRPQVPRHRGSAMKGKPYRETKRLLIIFPYLALLLSGFNIYKRMILAEHHISYLALSILCIRPPTGNAQEPSLATFSVFGSTPAIIIIGHLVRYCGSRAIPNNECMSVGLGCGFGSR